MNQEMNATPRKILIADDDESIQRLLKRVLTRRGFDVLALLTGSGVVETAAREQPDLILLDENMPGKCGGEILAVLRANSGTRMIPVIFQSGAASKEDVVRRLSTGADDFLCKPFSLDELNARIDSVLRRCTVNLDANPLTRLPGSSSIETEIGRLLQAGKLFTVLYVDLNEFKAYNDHYGSHRGDHVIRETARVLREAFAGSGAMVGHIGGDDFIVLCESGDVEALTQDALDRFDEARDSFYDAADRKAGFIVVTDRRGVERRFSPVSIAIGLVGNHVWPLRSVMEISAIGAEVKAAAKRQPGSSFFVDRRSRGTAIAGSPVP